MSTLIEYYNSVLEKISSASEAVQKTENAIAQLKEHKDGDFRARIRKLREQLEKIDEYQLKIQAFRQLAERNIESKNILTIEAPPGYRVNLNRLRQWAMMIDPMSSNDPYAQRVYVVAKCDELFLKNKKEEFLQRIAELESGEDTERKEELKALEEQLEIYNQELSSFASGQDMLEFSSAVKSANAPYWYSVAPTAYANPAKAAPAISPGAYALSLYVSREQRDFMKSIFGNFYDADGGRVLLPVELSTNQEFAIDVHCAPSRSKQLDRAVQNLVLNIIERYPAGQNRIYLLDAVRYNSAALGMLRDLENSFVMAPIPRNPEQLSAALERIVASFSDLDDRLETSDSVIEFNQKQSDPSKYIPRTTIILYGWPSAFEGPDKTLLQRIMTNYERYGISFVSVSYHYDTKRDSERSSLPEYAAQNAVTIRMASRETTVQMGDEPVRRFVWYTLGSEVSEEYIESCRKIPVKKEEISNDYLKLFPDFYRFPEYSRAYKPIALPFGIDSKGKVRKVSFENENFAAYLVGASRSGKSTLIHTLIAGIIRNYHPDNVELWLADFKQLEFKKYIAHCPPHVKYVLLDESTELVFDLIDKLTEKMMERQRLFARLGKERIDQLNPTALPEPVPVIFVILDEFSIMSQAIADSQIYKLRLQNLLAKGAALGIRFLFSSQTFTTGVSGLTPTARAQIQQRIAMKGSKEEISETLELSSNLKTEQVRNWMDALPPYYALLKYRSGADVPPQVIRSLVIYFSDGYQTRDRLIEMLSQQMTPAEVYQPGSIQTYVDKHPVLVDGNSYELFPTERLRREIQAVQDRDGAMQSDLALSLGTPRLMSSIRPVYLSQETRENLLFISRTAESLCASSVVTSSVFSFLLQGKDVQIWAYERDNLYRLSRENVWNRPEYNTLTFAEGIDSVCDAIYALKQRIQSRQQSDELIVMLGMERICADFDYVETGPSQGQIGNDEVWLEKKNKEFLATGAVVTSDEQERDRQLAMEWFARRKEIKKAGKVAGHSPEEIGKTLEEEKKAFFSQNTFSGTAEAGPVSQAAPVLGLAEQDKQEIPHPPGAYRASEDLQYIMKQGSRSGYHFLLVLNSYMDLKPMGIRLDWFRHRMAFQLSVDDSREVFSSKVASTLPEHICQYSDMINQFSFRPYLHPGLSWDGWSVDENGGVVDPFTTQS